MGNSVFSYIFVFASLLLTTKVFLDLALRPKKIDLSNNKHSRDFFIANAGASLRTSVVLSVTWMIITNKLYKDASAWSTFLETQVALEFLGVLALFLCVYGVMGVRKGRSVSLTEGENWRFWTVGNFQVTLYCVVPLLAFVFGFVYHSAVFYFN